VPVVTPLRPAPNVYHPIYARAAHAERLTEVTSVDRGAFGSRPRTTETGRNLPSTVSNNKRRLIAVAYSERAIPVSASSGCLAPIHDVRACDSVHQQWPCLRGLSVICLASEVPGPPITTCGVDFRHASRPSRFGSRSSATYTWMWRFSTRPRGICAKRWKV
jgi:hypothetical protein